jgi:hypothetical protein
VTETLKKQLGVGSKTIQNQTKLDRWKAGKKVWDYLYTAVIKKMPRIGSQNLVLIYNGWT